MEYILDYTDIFDKNLDELFNQKLTLEVANFIPGKPYKLTVTFDVNLLHDERFDECLTPEPKKKYSTRVDNIYVLLSYQLKKIEHVMKENGIVVYSTKIQGDEINNDRIIRIEIEEDFSEPMFHGRGKNKKRMGFSEIMPSRPYLNEVASKIKAERLGKIYTKNNEHDSR